MGGKLKLKLYQYDSRGNYLRSYDTQMEVFNKYFDGKKGEMFFGKDYRELPDGTYVSTYRIGRRLVKEIKIDNNPFCVNPRVDDKPISIYNLKKEKIATFKSIRYCSEMTTFTYSQLQGRLNKDCKYFPKSKDGLTFKYE